MFELIKTLTELPGPVGDEWHVQNFLMERWRSRVQKIELTDVGNLIVHVGGSGPTIVHKDLSSYSRPLTLQLIKSAERVDIPVQPAVFGVYGSDASAFTRQGIKAALVVVPTRYTHSPFEMVHLNDVEQTVRLLQNFLETEP